MKKVKQLFVHDRGVKVLENHQISVTFLMNYPLNQFLFTPLRKFVLRTQGISAC